MLLSCASSAPPSVISENLIAEAVDTLYQFNLQKELKLTYIFITHDLSIAKHMSDNIMVLYFGKCVEMKESEQLFINPQHAYTKQLIASVPQISKIFTS